LLWAAVAASAQPSKPPALEVQPTQASAPPARGNPSFVLVNRSGRTIQAAYASLSTERNWGEDRLGTSVLPPGQRFDIRLPEGPCEWDLRVVYDDGRREDRMRQNLCAVTEVVFDGTAAPSGPPAGAAAPPPARGNPSFVLVNRSGRTIQAAFASLSTERNWGEDRLGANVVLAPGQRFEVRLPEGPCEWDLRVVYDDARREDRMRQNLCAVTEVVFDGRDARALPPGGSAGGPAGGSGGGQAAPAQGNPSFTLVNRASRTIQAAYASLSTESSWGEDRLGSSVLPPGQRFDIRLPAGPCEWDLRVVYDDGRREERMRQNLCAVTEVVFDGRDARAQQGGPGGPGGSAGPGGPPAARPGVSFGTGFFVSAQGHMLTNAHVAGSCRNLAVLVDSQRLDAHLVRRDDTNDLALLRVSVPQPPAFARFRAGAPVRAGDGVVVAGFPLPTVLQNGLNITTGNISAMSGLGSNAALMQITAPVQPGNSGGPLLDLAGNVVGVIVSKLDAQRIARVTGDIPQNVNFAIQGAVARLFLESAGVRVPEASSVRETRAADVGEASRGYTYQIECRS
jgi:S1-C subfamily serine protease